MLLKWPDNPRVPKCVVPTGDEAVVSARGALPSDWGLCCDYRLDATGAGPSAGAPPAPNRGERDSLDWELRSGCDDRAKVFCEAARRARLWRDTATLIEEVGEMADPGVAHGQPLVAQPNVPGAQLPARRRRWSEVPEVPCQKIPKVDWKTQ